MSWEFEGLFDAIPISTEDSLLTRYWRAEDTAVRIGSMGYRTRTTKAGARLEAEIYPIFGRSKEVTARREKQRITPERQAQLNTRRSKRRLILMLETNFTTEDIHATLTYAGDEPTEERCRKDLRNFLGRVRRIRDRRNLPALKYLYAVGRDRDQRIHVHCVMNAGIDRDELEQIWGKGYANTMRLQEYGQGLQGMANYLYKQNEKARDRGERANYHMWRGSRNLKKPKEHVSDSKVSNRKVKKIAGSFGNLAKEIMEKIYPGYTLQDTQIMFSDVIDGVYIRCVMRQMEEKHDKKAKAGERQKDGAGV